MGPVVCPHSSVSGRALNVLPQADLLRSSYIHSEEDILHIMSWSTDGQFRYYAVRIWIFQHLPPLVQFPNLPIARPHHEPQS